jgi:hypothetical protein
MKKLVRVLKIGAMLNSKNIAKDGDWMPVLVARSGDEVEMRVPLITPDKRRSFNSIQNWLEDFGADEAALLISAWIVEQDNNGTTIGGGEPKEFLVIIHAGKLPNGSASLSAELAPIIRGGFNPYLGSWEPGEPQLGGFAADALVKGITN